MIQSLGPSDLRLSIEAASLGFSDTSELLQQPLAWIGQGRAEMATRFGLGMRQSDYNLFVLGEVGSGRSSLLLQAMKSHAADRPVPPDLCYLHNFDVPEKPRALRLPPGQGRLLRQLMAQLTKNLQVELPRSLGGQDFKVESELIEQNYKTQEAQAYAELDAFAEARQFSLYRESGRLVFTLRDAKGHAMTESEALTLPRERRAEIDRAEEELRVQIARFLEQMRPIEQAKNGKLAALRRKVAKPWLEHEVQRIRQELRKQIKDSVKLGAYLEQVMHDVLDSIELFQLPETENELRQEELSQTLARYRVNLVVDNHELSGAPVMVEDNPVLHSLFGSIEYQAENDVLVTDFSRIRAGSLHKAHGGFLMLHLRDLLSDEPLWEKLRRFLRSGRLQMEESGTAFTPIATVSLQPEAIDVDVKIILIGAIEQFYAVQEEDPEFARRFRVKVDFAESFLASQETYRASAIFVSHTCHRMGLPHFSAGAVGRLLEASHREADDQLRQSAIFAHTEALILESAATSQGRAHEVVEAQDVEAALRARDMRHDYPEQRLRESIAEGARLIELTGSKVGQLNGLTQVDLGDYRFGFPVKVTARTFAGDEGLLNIEREVEMSGPIHDKGVLILQSYLSSLFAHIAPLALDAAIVFEQEYAGVEGDSASCAEFYVLLSCLSGLPLKQGVAVTGAINQHGEVLPVGGINEKIEGYFRICEAAGLDGSQGVLIPSRNRKQLMLEHRVLDAVAKGVFHIHTAEHVSEGIELLTGLPSGSRDRQGAYRAGSVLGLAQKTLQAYRQACLQAGGNQKPARRKSR